MPTKSDRILSYLPGTFKRAPQKSALFAIVDAFGSELLHAENSLAAIMQSHWVNHADKGAVVIDDLARIASLYGLAPRCQKTENGANTDLCSLPSDCDESVEEFREHLKRYVRTFLDGTVTVQGILRITAEALALHIVDDYAEMDTWWERDAEWLVTPLPRGDDAAQRLFGFPFATAAGEPAHPATITGSVDLGAGVDLSETAVLRLQVDDTGPLTIDLTTNSTDPTAVSLDEIQTAINQAFNNQAVADHDDRSLSLTSQTTGPDSLLALGDGSDDAAEKVLGLKPHVYAGADARAAAATGTIDLSGGVDLQTEHFIRLVIDGTQTVEIDLPDEANVTLDQLQAAINDALDENIAAHDGRFLTLTSPTSGFSSSITFQSPATQNATVRLFGDINPFHQGQDAQPAQVSSGVDLSGGVDLREQSYLQISIDGDEAIRVNCAGQNPANTRPAEIAAAINAAFGATIARQNGRFLTISSLVSGSEGALIFETPEEGDATALILGILPRTYSGAAATAARLSGQIDLSEHPQNLNLLAQHTLFLAVDGRPSLEIDLRAKADAADAVTLTELVDAINTAIGENIASHDNKRLHLTSQTTGSDSGLQIKPLQSLQRRRFVTRAKIIDEAAQAIFGFVAKEASGTPATPARVTGQKDLSHGVDLRESRFLRITVDKRTADIDCSGLRIRATLLAEIVTKINAAFPEQVAWHNNKNLILQSPTSGADSLIAFEPPQATDALPTLLGVEAGITRGLGATGVRLVGTTDLSEGIDLAAGASLRLGIDGDSPVEIILTTADAQLSLNQLVLQINATIERNVASHNGSNLLIISPQTGAESQIELAASGEADVTADVLGFVPPRTYQGTEATPARVTGTTDLSGLLDLRTARFLEIGVDGETAVVVDCAAEADDPSAVSLGDIVTAINAELPSAPASSADSHLILTSATSGINSQISLKTHITTDARATLFGSMPDQTHGEAPAAATITGEVDLLTPVDLAERSLLRLAINGQRPIEIDVAGVEPQTTFLDEIITALNIIHPSLASATDEDRLQLTAPTNGAGSSLELRPLRYLELLDYPLQDGWQKLEKDMQHRESLRVNNKGAAETFAHISISNPQGIFGATLVNRTLGWQLRLNMVLGTGEVAHIWRNAAGQLTAVIETPQGEQRPIPDSDLIVGPLEAQSETAVSLDKTTILTLPKGRSDWIYLDCQIARFNEAAFDQAYFPGDLCIERGIFNISHFKNAPPQKIIPVFAAKPPRQNPATQVTFSWQIHQTGAFLVNLPADLPPRFGGRFNQARFGQSPDTQEKYDKAVAEPPNDPDHLVKLIQNNEHSLVTADFADIVPLGWEAAAMPFRQPQFLTLGKQDEAARLYLSEEGLEGFIEIKAREPGTWGNAIALSARPGGPAMYDVCIMYAGALFENARAAVRGQPPIALTQEMLKASPVGILQAKAAGVFADVTRNGAN